MPLLESSDKPAKKQGKKGGNTKRKKTVENAAKLVQGNSSSKPLLALKLLGMLLVCLFSNISSPSPCSPYSFFFLPLPPFSPPPLSHHGIQQNKTTRDLTLSQPHEVQTMVGLLMGYIPFLQTRVCTLCGLDVELVRGASETGIILSYSLTLFHFLLVFFSHLFISLAIPLLKSNIFFLSLFFLDLAVSDELLLEAFVLYCKLLIHINGTSAEVAKV